MMRRMRLMAVVGVAATLMVALWGTLALARPAAMPLSRSYEGVAVSGTALAAAQGASVGDLALYAYRAGVWEPVLFQVDEVTATGTYTTTEDGLFDANDEVAFMAADGGDEAPTTSWPNDAAARSQPRHAIRVSDPLLPTESTWLYLYRSPTLPRSTAAPYVAWDAATQHVSATAYSATFSQSVVGLSDLTLNGSTSDILDRQKLRLSGTLTVGPIPLPLSYNEETIRDVITQSLTLDLPITGPVRAIAGTPEQPSAFYGRYYELTNQLPLTDTQVTIPGIGTGMLHVASLRTSLDLRDPTQSGMAPTRYYDSNGQNVPVDGVADSVPTTPVPTWFQYDGALGGLAVIQDVSPANGTVRGYYLDNGAVNSNDTGDQRSFGDSGAVLTNPNGTVQLRARAVVLPVGAGNQGAALRQQANAPLTTTVQAQSYPGGGDSLLYLPLVMR